MTVIVGIVGPPCSGKSTVARRLCASHAKQGSESMCWIDADRIAKSMLLEPDIKARLTELFGAGILDDEGNIDRSEVAQLVFGESASAQKALQGLTDIVHPPTHQAIWQRLLEAQQNQLSHVVLDVPLLIESKWHWVCDEIWFLDVPERQQQVLLERRGWSRKEWDRRLQRQMSLERKRGYATQVLNNAGDEAFLEDQIDSLTRGWETPCTASDHCMGAGNSI